MSAFAHIHICAPPTCVLTHTLKMHKDMQCTPHPRMQKRKKMSTHDFGGNMESKFSDRGRGSPSTQVLMLGTPNTGHSFKSFG